MRINIFNFSLFKNNNMVIHKKKLHTDFHLYSYLIILNWYLYNNTVAIKMLSTVFKPYEVLNSLKIFLFCILSYMLFL